MPYGGIGRIVHRLWQFLGRAPMLLGKRLTTLTQLNLAPGETGISFEAARALLGPNSERDDQMRELIAVIVAATKIGAAKWTRTMPSIGEGGPKRRERLPRK